MVVSANNCNEPSNVASLVGMILKTSSLDKWTYNKSLQKMIESFRVKESDKLIIKTMKKA